MRSCPGDRQRRGKNDYLKCHKVDLDIVNPFDIKLLEKFVTDDAEIMNRKQSGLCSRCQRKIAKTIKHARCLGMLPHLGEFQRMDSKITINEDTYHDSMITKTLKSKTIL